MDSAQFNNRGPIPAKRITYTLLVGDRRWAQMHPLIGMHVR